MNSNLTNCRVLILLLIFPAFHWILHPVIMCLLQPEVPSGIIFITSSSLLPILSVACPVFTLGYWHQHCLRIAGRACLVLLPSQQMPTWLKTSLSQRRLEFHLVVEIPSLLCLVQVVHNGPYHNIHPLFSSCLWQDVCSPTVEHCTSKEHFDIKHKSFSFPLCILHRLILSHDYAPVIHTVLHYLHNSDHIPLLPCKIPTFAAIPLSFLILSALPMVKLISDLIIRLVVSWQISFLLTPQIQISKNHKELIDELMRLPNTVKNQLVYQRTARWQMISCGIKRDYGETKRTTVQQGWWFYWTNEISTPPSTHFLWAALVVFFLVSILKFYSK